MQKCDDGSVCMLTLTVTSTYRQMDERGKTKVTINYTTDYIYIYLLKL